MIDNPRQVTNLMQKMNLALPIQAFATTELIDLLEKRNIIFNKNQNVIIEKIVYFGDDGGISCYINSEEKIYESIIVSITHLRLSSRHPLASDIKKYQIRRVKKISR